MSNRNINTNKLNNQNIVKCIRIFLIVALSVIIFYPPYLQGLFFEQHVIPTQIFMFIIFIIFFIYKWLKRDYIFFKTPIEYVSLGFVIIYFISIFVAVHTRSAIIEWLKYCMYFAVFYMISDLTDNLKSKMFFLWTIVISAVGVSIIGLDAAMGGNIVGKLNNLFKALGAQGDLFFGLFVGDRIHSTLQYSNALASYTTAVFFVTVGLLMVHNKWWQKLILSSFAYLLFLVFMLTKSRGAQLLFPIAVVILLITAPKYNRIKTVAPVVLIVIPAGLISLFISPYLSAESINHKALLLLLLGLIITVLICLVEKCIGKLMQKINWKIYIIAIIIFVIAGATLINYIINQAVPIELSLENSNENKFISVEKDVHLKPNTEYILRFDAVGKIRDKTSSDFFVKLSNKNIKNILFNETEELIWQNYSIKDGYAEYELLFRTREDTELINISFLIYYSGTSVKINNVSVIDAKTGKIERNIVLKNKYNLDKVISRFQNIWLQQSVVSRAVFYKDGFNIFKNKWFLGAGGGAWNYLYRQYQSYNYTSSQAHNYPLQLGIETGILGIIILISLVIILFNCYINYSKQDNANNDGLLCASIITAISTLFMHSLIDFDFSESSMLLLFWQLIAIFDRELIDTLVEKDVQFLNIKKKIIKSNHFINMKSKSIIFIGVFVSVIALYLSLKFFIALSFATQSFKNLQDDDIEIAISKMEKAVTLDRYNEKYVIGYNPIPSRPDITAGLTDILFLKNEKYKIAQENGEVISDNELYLFQKQLSKAAVYIKDIEQQAKNNLSLTSDLASYYFKIGEIDKGINYINLAITYYPFEPLLWHSKIDVYYQLMKKYFNNEDYVKAKEFLLKGLNVIGEAKNVNKKNMDPFVFNENTVKLLQTMKFMQDSWDTTAIFDVNEVVLYSMFDLDVNSDGIPDQWRINNKELMNVSITNKDLSIQTSEKAYLYTYYPIKLNKGKIYKIEVKTRDNVENLSFYISGITFKEIPLSRESGKYTAEIMVENNANENGNQFRIYTESDCIIESIIVKEKK